MSEQQTGHLWYQSCPVKLMILAVAVALACGGVLLFFYFIGEGYQHDRAAGVAAWASGEIERLSKQVLEAAPEDATLTGYQQPHSSVRRPALSDGSPQYASASARQDYNIQLGLNVVLAHYDQLFASWEWDQVSLDFSLATSLRLTVSSGYIDMPIANTCWWNFANINLHYHQE